MAVRVLVLKSGEDVIADVQEMLSSDEKVIGYFLTRPCVVKLSRKGDLPPEETDPKSQKKSELSITMFPWVPLAREKSIPLTSDWVVTMVTPIEKIYDMYVEDILNEGQKTNQTSSSDEQSDSGLTD
jgi:hypothetical protein